MIRPVVFRPGQTEREVVQEFAKANKEDSRANKVDKSQEETHHFFLY
jgi:hypothetical protein